VVLQGLVHPQAGDLLAQVMALDTTTEQAVLGLDTEVLDIQVVDLATMDLSVVNIQALAVRAILQVDNMVDILEVQVASHRVVQEVLLKAIHPQVILLVAHLGEPHLDLILALEPVQEHLQHLWLPELLLQDRIPLQARLLLTQRQPHLPPHLRHRRRPPPPPSRHLPIHHLLHLLSQGLRVLLLLTHGQQALPLPTTHPPTLLMAQGLPLLVEQVVLGPQVKDSQVVIPAVGLLEATQVILEDLATLHLVILGVELLLEPLVLAILVGDLIHHPKGATLLMVTPKGHLEVIHPQAQAIPTDLKAVQWVHLVDMLLVLQVPHPPKVAVALHGVW